jgi:hypothetical protein
MSQHFKQFQTLEDFYSFWDKQDHTKHTAEDFALRCLIISDLKGETLGQTVNRLKRSFQPIHSYNKWGTGAHCGRSLFDTLKNTLLQIRGGWGLRTFKQTELNDRPAFGEYLWDIFQQLPHKEHLQVPVEYVQQAA